MSKKITDSDYKNILKYYNIDIPDSKAMLKKKAHEILSEKLCRCIKEIPSVNESKAIGICTENIFVKKGLKRGTFKCKGKRKVTFRKMKSLRSTQKRR